MPRLRPVSAPPAAPPGLSAEQLRAAAAGAAALAAGDWVGAAALRRLVAPALPAALGDAGESAVLLATLAACADGCRCAADAPSPPETRPFPPVAMLRLLVDAGAPRGIAPSRGAPFVPAGRIALHVAAAALHLCAVRALTLSDAPATFAVLRLSPLLGARGARGAASDDELRALAARDADWDARPGAPSAASPADAALLEDLAAAVGVRRPAGAAGAAGAAAHGGRYLHRTRVHVRDAAGRTPLGLAAQALLIERQARRAHATAAGMGADASAHAPPSAGEAVVELLRGLCAVEAAADAASPWRRDCGEDLEILGEA